MYNTKITSWSHSNAASVNLSAYHS